MYKVSEVAKILGVDNSSIFEKLITYKKILDQTTNRVDGVLMLTDESIRVLRDCYNLEKAEDITEDVNIIKDRIKYLQKEIEEMDKKISEIDEVLIKKSTAVLHLSKNLFSLPRSTDV